MYFFRFFLIRLKIFQPFSVVHQEQKKKNTQLLNPVLLFLNPLGERENLQRQKCKEVILGYYRKISN